MNPINPVIVLTGVGDQIKNWLQEIIDERLQWLIEEGTPDNTDPSLNILLIWTSDTISLKASI